MESVDNNGISVIEITEIAHEEQVEVIEQENPDSAESGFTHSPTGTDESKTLVVEVDVDEGVTNGQDFYSFGSDQSSVVGPACSTPSAGMGLSLERLTSGELVKLENEGFLQVTVDCSSQIQSWMYDACAVCGDNASSCHYGAKVCEACSGFFKRCVQKDLMLSCQASEECDITKASRNRCQFCRLQKCLLVGMKIESVLCEKLSMEKNDWHPQIAVKKFKCSRCGETFTMKGSLKRHHSRKHGDVPMEVTKLECLHQGCDKLFDHKIEMLKHIEEEHQGRRKDFKCSLCEDMFVTKHSLKRHHSRRHGGEPMEDAILLKCLKQNCNQFFDHKLDLLKHMEEEHQIATKIFKCSLCDEVFTTNGSLKRHHSRKHDGMPMAAAKSKCLHQHCDRVFDHKLEMLKHMEEEHQSKMKIFKCSLCEEILSTRDSLKRHHSRKHDDQPMPDTTTIAKSKCLHPTCDRMFYHKFKMLKHMEEDHQVESTSSNHTFDSEKEFFDWKEKEEVANCVYFSKRSGGTVGKSTSYCYYVCQHDGSAEPHRSKGQPARKSLRKNAKGRVKTGITCPARMSVRVSRATGVFHVTYVRTHSHEPSAKDTLHHPTPKSILTEIEKKISQGIPRKELWREICESLGQRGNLNEEAAKGVPTYPFVSKRKLYKMYRDMNSNVKEECGDFVVGSHDVVEADSSELSFTTTPVQNCDEAPPSTPETVMESARQDLSNFQEILQNEDMVKAILPHISGTLKRLLSQCTAAVSSPEALNLEAQPSQEKLYRKKIHKMQSSDAIPYKKSRSENQF